MEVRAGVASARVPSGCTTKALYASEASFPSATSRSASFGSTASVSPLAYGRAAEVSDLADGTAEEPSPRSRDPSIRRPRAHR